MILSTLDIAITVVMNSARSAESGNSGRMSSIGLIKCDHRIGRIEGVGWEGGQGIDC
jgi:hypothetical protein